MERALAVDAGARVGQRAAVDVRGEDLDVFCWRAKVRALRFSASAVSRTLLMESAALREPPSCTLLLDVTMLLFLARAMGVLH